MREKKYGYTGKTMYIRHQRGYKTMSFKELWAFEKSKLNCDIMLVRLGDHYNTYYTDAKRLYHDFDFTKINRLNGEIFSATITEQKLFSVLDYYKSKGIIVKILSEGK